MKIKITARTEEETLRADAAVQEQLDIIARETASKRPVVEGWFAPPNLDYSFEFPVVVIRDDRWTLWRGYGFEDLALLSTAWRALVVSGLADA